jgi:hypothetical protein
MALLAAAPTSTATQNLLQDGGFEQFLDQPGERGNPFKAWSGWKWVYLFGSGRIWFDDLRLEKIQGPAARPGLTLGEVEEAFHGFTGPGGLTCPSCGLKADPAAGVSRPVRFLTPDGAHVTGLEYRAIKTADGWLAYVNNLDRKHDKQLKLATGLELSRIRNLTLETDLPLGFTLPAGETYILRLNANQSK